MDRNAKAKVIAGGDGSRHCRAGVAAFLGLSILLRAGGSPARDHIQTASDLLNQGKLEEAEKEARLALDTPGSRALALAALGTVRLRQNRYEEGAEYLERALSLNPRLIGARISLGGAYVLLGRREQAGRAFRAALRIDPRNITARLDLAQLESSNGNHRSSLEVAEPVANELRHLADGLILLATDYAALGQKERIRPLVQDWEVLADVPPVDLTVDFASVLIGSGLVPEGIRLLEARKARNVSSWRLELTLGEAYAAEGKLSQAEENYQAALGLNRDCLPCLMKIAALSERQANTEKALSFLMRAKAMAPDDPEVLFQFGKVCFERDLLDDAVPALEKAAALRPDNDTYAYVLGSAYVGKGTNAKAVQTFQKLVLKHPADAAVNYALGAALFLNEDADKAEPYLQKSIELQPRQKLAYYYLGLAAEKKGDATRAIAMLRDLTDRYPDYPQAQAALGSALLREKQYPEAEVRLRSAIRLDPNLVQAHYQLGRLLARTGRDDESRKEIETARRLERDERAKKGQQIRILDPEQAN